MSSATPNIRDQYIQPSCQASDDLVGKSDVSSGSHYPMTPHGNDHISHESVPNSSDKSNLSQESRPMVKQFIPYTGVKNTPLSQAKWSSSSANSIQRPYQPTCTGFTPVSGALHSGPNQFTPAPRAVNSLVRQPLYCTPTGVTGPGGQSIQGKSPANTKSNLFCATGATMNTPVTSNLLDTSIDSTQDLSNSQVEIQKKDISRRTRLLGRIPSPPPLSPLPSPMPTAVRRRFRPPNRHGLVSSVSKCVGDAGKEDRINQSSKMNDIKTDRQLPVLATPHKLFNVDDLTSSQREVQELMGMSPRCLQELDMEWSQQTPVTDVTSHQFATSSGVRAIGDHVQNTGSSQDGASLDEQSESPPMDLDYDTQSQRGQHSENNLASSVNDSTVVHTKARLRSTAKPAQDCDGKTNLGDTVEHVTVDGNSSTPTHKLTVKAVQTQPGEGIPQMQTSFTSPTCSASQTKTKPNKRFCTRADYDVIDFESLEGVSEDGGSRRRTRSSTRKSKN